MPNETSTSSAERNSGKTFRMHYLDWLQVLAVLGVFLFHAVHPFDDLTGWHIKNAEKSILATFFVGFFNLWGMPFFFTMAGATSWFSLRRRTPGRYVRERFTRLLIPFIIGSIVLTPIQAYYELTHQGWWGGGSIIEFILSSEARTYFYSEHHPITLSPRIFGELGYHLWFVGFLFTFALVALPVFMLLKQEAGKRLVAPLAQLAEKRGGLLVFILPLVLVRFILQPFFPGYTSWADFFFLLLFFISGFILLSNERFLRGNQRDWLLHLILALACTMFFFSVAAGVPVGVWLGSPGTPGFYISQTLWGINSWCWTMTMFYVGMRFLNFSNNWLQYSREASYPIFMIHQPVIIIIAFYVAQWEVGLTIKMLIVVSDSLVVSIGLYELLVRRINPVRALFGMRPLKKQSVTLAMDS